MTEEKTELTPPEVKFMVQQALDQLDRPDLPPDDVIRKEALQGVLTGEQPITVEDTMTLDDLLRGEKAEDGSYRPKIEWQYFRPGQRPEVRYKGEVGNKVKLQILDGPVREYEEINSIDDIKHMRCNDIDLQVKFYRGFQCDNGYSLRAVSQSFVEHHAEELGAGKIQIEHGLSQSSGLPQYSAHSGIRGTGSYVEEVSVTLEPVNISQSDALVLIDKLLDVHRATELDSDSYSIRYNGNHLEVSTAAGANTANAVQWFEAIRFHVNSHWISRVSDDCFDTIPF